MERIGAEMRNEKGKSVDRGSLDGKISEKKKRKKKIASQNVHGEKPNGFLADETGGARAWLE